MFFSPLKQLNYAKCPSLPSRPVPLTAPPPPTTSAGRLRLHRPPAAPAAAAAPRWRPRSGAKNADRTRRNANDDVTPGGGDRRWGSFLHSLALQWWTGWMDAWWVWWLKSCYGFGGEGGFENIYQKEGRVKSFGFWRCNWWVRVGG